MSPCTPLIRVLLTTTLVISAGLAAAAEEAGTVKDIPSQRVLSVKVSQPDGYAPAFGMLVEYYLRRRTQVVFPQMSLEMDAGSFAAIAFLGEAAETDEVKILDLPAAKVITLIHKGPYDALSASIGRTFAAVGRRGCIPDTAKVLRLLHPNSPDNTAAADLVTEIQLPVTGC